MTIIIWQVVKDSSYCMTVNIVTLQCWCARSRYVSFPWKRSFTLISEKWNGFSQIRQYIAFFLWCKFILVFKISLRWYAIARNSLTNYFWQSLLMYNLSFDRLSSYEHLRCYPILKGSYFCQRCKIYVRLCSPLFFIILYISA